VVVRLVANPSSAAVPKRVRHSRMHERLAADESDCDGPKLANLPHPFFKSSMLGCAGSCRIRCNKRIEVALVVTLKTHCRGLRSRRRLADSKMFLSRNSRPILPRSFIVM